MASLSGGDDVIIEPPRGGRREPPETVLPDPVGTIIEVANQLSKYNKFAASRLFNAAERVQDALVPKYRA